MINDTVAKEIAELSAQEISRIKNMTPVSYKFKDSSICPATHRGLVSDLNVSNITEVIPYAVGAIRDIYEVLNEKYYDLPFTQEDFIATRPPVLSGKNLINGLDRIMKLTPVIDSKNQPNLLAAQSAEKIDYVSLTIYLCSAVKELKQRLDLLQNK